MDLEENGRNVENLVIFSKQNKVKIKIDKELYPLDVIYLAAYVLTEKAYVILRKDSDEMVEITLKSKHTKVNLEELGMQLNKELIKYVVYKSNAEKNSKNRDQFIQAALLSNINSVLSENEIDDGSYLDDPLGISKPWEENMK